MVTKSINFLTLLDRVFFSAGMDSISGDLNTRPEEKFFSLIVNISMPASKLYMPLTICEYEKLNLNKTLIWYSFPRGRRERPKKRGVIIEIDDYFLVP